MLLGGCSRHRHHKSAENGRAPCSSCFLFATALVCAKRETDLPAAPNNQPTAAIKSTNCPNNIKNLSWQATAKINQSGRVLLGGCGRHRQNRNTLLAAASNRRQVGKFRIHNNIQQTPSDKHRLP